MRGSSKRQSRATTGPYLALIRAGVEALHEIVILELHVGLEGEGAGSLLGGLERVEPALDELTGL